MSDARLRALSVFGMRLASGEKLSGDSVRVFARCMVGRDLPIGWGSMIYNHQVKLVYNQAAQEAD